MMNVYVHQGLAHGEHDKTLKALQGRGEGWLQQLNSPRETPRKTDKCRRPGQTRTSMEYKEILKEEINIPDVLVITVTFETPPLFKILKTWEINYFF